MSIRSIWFIVWFKSSISLLTFCVPVLPLKEKYMLQPLILSGFICSPLSFTSFAQCTLIVCYVHKQEWIGTGDLYNSVAVEDGTAGEIEGGMKISLVLVWRVCIQVFM